MSSPETRTAMGVTTGLALSQLERFDSSARDTGGKNRLEIVKSVGLSAVWFLSRNGTRSRKVPEGALDEGKFDGCQQLIACALSENPH